MTEPLLSIRDLCVDYITDTGPVRAIDGVSLDVMPGEILGIAGESGCGKSTLAKAILRILPPPAVISGGRIDFQGRDVLRMDESELRAMRWRRISMVFQSAMDALNPVTTIGEQIVDTLAAHGVTSNERARARAEDLLEMVDIRRSGFDSYAHQLSGGMRQRVGIAIALALEPSLVILDEPTTALDVIVEREILSKIKALQREQGFSVIFITHDLTRMLQVSDRVAVFYAARLAEVAPSETLRSDSHHPYTRGLLRALPSVSGGGQDPLSIPGAPPSLQDPPDGCRFNPRCGQVVDLCRRLQPELKARGSGHDVACHVDA